MRTGKRRLEGMEEVSVSYHHSRLSAHYVLTSCRHIHPLEGLGRREGGGIGGMLALIERGLAGQDGGSGRDSGVQSSLQEGRG